MWYDIHTNSMLTRESAMTLVHSRQRIANHESRLLGTYGQQIRSFQMNPKPMVSKLSSTQPIEIDIIDRWTNDTMVMVPSMRYESDSEQSRMSAKSSMLTSLEQAKIPFYNWEEFGGMAVVLSRNHRQEIIQALSAKGAKITYQAREVMEQKWRNSQIETTEYQISRKGQDRFFQLSENGVLISLLFDGHGTDTVIDYISTHRTDFAALGFEPFPETNAEAFEKTSKVFIEFENTMRKKIKDMYSGSTLVVAVHKIATKKVFFAHIGDSRAVWSIGGKVFGTNDHKPSEENERKRVTDLGGRVTQARRDVMRVNGNLATSRSFGDESLKVPGNSESDRKKDLISVIPSVYGPYNLPSGSFYGLGSDGVFDVISNDQIYSLLSNKGRGSNVSRVVVEAAVEKGSLDDITFGTVYIL